MSVGRIKKINNHIVSGVRTKSVLHVTSSHFKPDHYLSVLSQKRRNVRRACMYPNAHAETPPERKQRQLI